MLNGQGTFSMFREPSYITFAGGAGNIDKLVFEANIIPYYMLSLSNSDRWGIEISPQVILRMYNKESFPVRTPSFMPRATAFYQFVQAADNKPDFFGYFSWFHHSNGQENPFYNTDSATINTQSGNFATNAIETGIFMSKANKRNPYIIRYLKLSSIYHYRHIEELNRRIGDLRFFIDFQSSVNISKTLRFLNLIASTPRPNSSILNLSTKIGWIADDMNGVKAFSQKRLIFRETISFKPNFLRDITLFAQYYYGQDYYNIYFNRQLHVLRFGIMAKPGFLN
jgi:hypothetical protein